MTLPYPSGLDRPAVGLINRSAVSAYALHANCKWAICSDNRPMLPDTPYSFYIINGKVTPYFYDSEKSVIWQLNSVDLNQVFNDMRSIEASSKKIQFAAYGGDMAAFLVVDFSDKLKSPKVTHWVRHDGF